MHDIVLRNVPKQRAKLIDVFVKIGLIDENLSVVRWSEAAQRIEQRRLSRPTGAENSNELAWFR